MLNEEIHLFQTIILDLIYNKCHPIHPIIHSLKSCRFIIRRALAF